MTSPNLPRAILGSIPNDSTPGVLPTTWLRLSEAARALEVHPGSLRRWADAGLVESSRTPGGQRRFTRVALARFVDASRSGALGPATTVLQGGRRAKRRLSEAQRAERLRYRPRMSR